MGIMDIDVAHVAKLGWLPLDDEEKRLFEKQLGKILSFFQKLDAVDVRKAFSIRTFHAGKAPREDEPSPSLPQSEVLSNVPKVERGTVVIKGIFEG